MAFVYWIHLPEHTDMFREGYIGFTSKSVGERWAQHKFDACRYKHQTVYKALAKHGDRLIITTLVEGSTSYCLDMEFKLRSAPRIGWNIKVGGNNGSLGVTPSTETRKKMSEAHLGIKNHFFDQTHTLAQKSKWSAERAGKPFSEAAMQKSIETKKNFPWNVPNARKDVWALSDAIRLKINDGLSGKRLADYFNLNKDSIKTIVRRLHSGWVPSEDSYWRSFITEYET